MMLPGMPGPGGMGGPMGPLGGPPAGGPMGAPAGPAPMNPMSLLGGGGGGGPQDNSFATGMLAGLGLREMSQLLGLSKRGKGAAPQGAELPSADQLGGQLGDIDKLVILSRLMGSGGGPSPSGPPAPMGPPASPLGGAPPALAALMASRGPVASPAGPPVGAAPAGPPIAGGGTAMVPLLLNQLLMKSGGLV